MQRLTRVIEEATGIEPIIVDHRYNFGVTFLVGRTLTAARVAQVFPQSGRLTHKDASLRVPTDD